MPFRRRYSSRRRYSRRRIPGATTFVKGTRRARDFPTFAPGRARQLVRVYPTTESTHNRIMSNAWVEGTTINDNAVEVLNKITQGTSTQQRVGNRIFMRSLILDFSVNFENRRLMATPNTPIDWRVAVIYDRRPTGTFPVPGEVFDDSEPLAFPKMATRERFEILYMKTFTSNPISVFNGGTVATVYGMHPLVHRRIAIPIRRSTTFINGQSGGALSDMQYGALIVCWWNLDPPSGVTNARVFWTHKLSFTDYA